jgi:adenosylcobinamide-GDP ribazoletransferase
MAVLAWRQIGGITGDVFGAVEQVAETTVLLTLAAQLS